MLTKASRAIPLRITQQQGATPPCPNLFPTSVPVLVIGAGVHGLSTAWHLAKQGAAACSSSTRPSVARRRVGDRLRGRPQQLLPAGDVRADGGLRRGVGVGSGGAPLPRQRLHRARSAGAGERPGRGLRAPAADRLPVRAVRGRRGGRRAHARAVPRLARARPDRLPARARRRVRLQPGVDARPRREGASRPAPRSPPASRSPGSSSDNSGAVTAVHTSQGNDRTPTRSSSRSGRGSTELWAMLGLPDTIDVRQPDGDASDRPADVDLLVPPGGRDRVRPRAVRHRRRQGVAGAARRQRPAAARRRRRG